MNFAFPEGGEGEGVLWSLAFKGEVLLPDSPFCFLGEEGGELALLNCFAGVVDELLLALLSPPFPERFVFEEVFFSPDWSPGSGLSDFLEVVLVGEAGLFEDFLFKSTSNLSYSVAK